MTLVKKGRGSLEQARGTRHVAAIGRLRTGGTEVPRRMLAQGTGMRVDGSERSPVPERLLEVVSDDLLELRHSGSGNVDKPLGEALVQAGPCPFEQAVVGGIPHENVAELVTLIGKRRGKLP